MASPVNVISDPRAWDFDASRTGCIRLRQMPDGWSAAMNLGGELPSGETARDAFRIRVMTGLRKMECLALE